MTDTKTTEPVRSLLPIATPRQTLALLWHELRRHRVVTVLALATVIAASAAGLVAPWMLGVLVDSVTADGDRDDLVNVVVVMVVAAVAGAILTGLGATLVARVGETVLARVRERVVDKTLGLPAAATDRVGTGDLLSRVGDDVAVVTNAITTTGPLLTSSAFTVLLTGAGLFALDWRLGIAGLVSLPMYLLALRWYLPRSGPFYAKERVAMGERSQALVGSLRGRVTVRAYRLEDDHLSRIDARSREAMGLSIGVFKLFTRFASRGNRAEFVGLTVVLVVGFFLVKGDMTTVGATTAAALYFHRLFNPLGALVMKFDEIQSAGASLARLAGVARMPMEEPPSDPPRPTGTSIEIRDVSHSYQDGPRVLTEVSLRIEPGETVALVGASGAGKTTLAAIAAGVLSPVSGQVRLGGVPLAELGEPQLRARVALLSQEVHVFSGPLLDDVRLARPTASDEEVVAALEAVGATGWVTALPDGPHTVVGENAHSLTAAQAQQLALGRLMLADPEVAILDEATAEAGSAGARQLERAAAAATAGRTTLVVAHRLTQAELADRVVVMRDGQIVESGSHSELLAAEGAYHELWHAWTGM